eukprot:TRINITY_DN5057_c0_g1_i1.p2 TRINITY_DN5057_c0_g1~~TRINITY_DN5057_c0_g1_i1.p2  ORF type:complete len:168 (+),score=27.44 TRINITY_DN5057_c0_g1_i1:40-543(+)
MISLSDGDWNTQYPVFNILVVGNDSRNKKLFIQELRKITLDYLKIRIYDVSSLPLVEDENRANIDLMLLLMDTDNRHSYKQIQSYLFNFIDPYMFANIMLITLTSSDNLYEWAITLDEIDTFKSLFHLDVQHSNINSMPHTIDKIKQHISAKRSGEDAITMIKALTD